jgi:hypothetical protein
VIGYYVHHVGSGHLHRARAVAAVSRSAVTGLSSLPRPDGWSGEWVGLARDDEDLTPEDVTAGGRLHWVPRQSPGLRDRMATIAEWLARARPDVVVSDVSVEVALLARLHGVPVVSLVLPGDRTDPAHLLGYGISDALVACWPEGLDGLTPGLPEELRARLTCVGGLSRFPVSDASPTGNGGRVVVLLGRGGGHPSPQALEAARAQTPDWHWTVLGPGHGWSEDVAGALAAADAVVTQAGENALAEVAACRRPAIVVPADRPHGEQRTTARVLAEGSWPVVVEDEFPLSGWAERLSAARRLDGARWAGWCDGKAADRIVDVLDGVAGGQMP